MTAPPTGGSGAVHPPSRVVAYVPDLMDRSRLARLPLVPVVVVPTVPELVATAAPGDLVVVDLSRPGVLEALPGLPGHVVGFAPHVDAELLARAAAAGCTEVLPRSRFFATLPARLGGADGDAGAPPGGAPVSG